MREDAACRGGLDDKRVSTVAGAVVLDQAGFIQPPDTSINRIPIKPECTLELIDAKGLLVTQQRQQHEVADLYRIALDHTGQRIVGFAEARERFLANRRCEVIVCALVNQRLAQVFQVSCVIWLAVFTTPIAK